MCSLFYRIYDALTIKTHYIFTFYCYVYNMYSVFYRIYDALTIKTHILNISNTWYIRLICI